LKNKLCPAIWGVKTASGALRVEQTASKIVKEYLKEGNKKVLERDTTEKFNRIIKLFESNIK
jgi:hypothetical protein